MLTIIQHPHPTLKIKSLPVTIFDEQLQHITEEMISTMKDARGIGLAANQVNLTMRIFVMQVDDQKPPYVFINPEVTPINEQTIDYKEGCLSFPGVIQNKTRKEKVHVKWQNIKGEFLEEKFEGLEAICIQHENDHIDGITFIHDLSPLKQQFALKKLQKTHNIKKKI